MSPSITYWNRLEPRPRHPAVARALEAHLRDPLWLLTRQWQLGEYGGEDAGSPAHVEAATRVAPLLGWRPGKEDFRPIGNLQRPIEALAAAEPFTPDAATRVEVGQVFESLLAQAKLRHLIAFFRTAYPLPERPQEAPVGALFTMGTDAQPDLDSGLLSAALRQAFHTQEQPLSVEASVWVKVRGSQWVVTDDHPDQTYAVRREENVLRVYRAVFPDGEAERFLRVCAGRAVDGVALLEAFGRSREGVLPDSLTDPAQRDAALHALDDLTAWVEEVFGAFGHQDALAWKAERLEYDVDVISTGEALGGAPHTLLTAHPGRDGTFDWYAFDQQGPTTTVGGFPTDPLNPERLKVLPLHVRFRGMPNHRWWDFESGTTNFGEVEPERRDLAKLIMVTFMLVHGNDWFVVPFDQPVGTQCWVNDLLVHDVFGDTTRVKRAEQIDAGGGPRRPDEWWTMFATSRQDAPAEPSGFFLPPSAAAAVQVGPVLEEVRFLRDEMANMVWAVEHLVENGVGLPWPGRERDVAARPSTQQEVSGDVPEGVPLRYRIQTTVPSNWLPFLPVASDEKKGEYVLELSTISNVFTEPVQPAGRVLQPHRFADAPYRVEEVEVPRVGTRVLRQAYRSRGVDGSTHLWVARRKVVGLGEGSSGLTFDSAVPNA